MHKFFPLFLAFCIFSIFVSAAEIKCNNCGETPSKLYLCSRCKSVRYCSTDCQRADWSNHKPNCIAPVQAPNSQVQQLNLTPVTANTANLSAASNQPTKRIESSCANCGSKEHLHTCSQCRSTSYCSKKCQEKHLTSHKEECEEAFEAASKRERALDIELPLIFVNNRMYENEIIVPYCDTYTFGPLEKYLDQHKEHVFAVNKQGHTILMNLCMSQKTDMAIEFIKQYIPLAYRKAYINLTDKQGKNALYHAAQASEVYGVLNTIRLLEYLLSQGGDIHSRSTVYGNLLQFFKGKKKGGMYKFIKEHW